MRRLFSILLLVNFPLWANGDDEETVDLGLAIFRDHCAACHLQTGMGIREMNAPSIAGLPRWYVSDQLRKFRRNERGFQEDDLPGHLMKANAEALDERSIAFVGRYIERLEVNKRRNTLNVRPSDTTENLYNRKCANCHGDQGEGNRNNRIPPLTSQPDWYLLGQMDNFNSQKRVHSEKLKEDDLPRDELKALIAWIAELRGIQKKVE